METNHLEIIRKMDKQALIAYSSLAAGVYSSALAYCYFTNHFFEMGIVGAVMLGLGILIANVYFSIGAQSQNHETGNSYQQAA